MARKDALEGHWELLFPSEYLRGSDLQGKDVTLTIAYLDKQEVHGRDGQIKMSSILHFEEMIARAERDRNEVEKKLILNKTNTRTIAGLYGPLLQDWTGKRITLYPQPGMYFGEQRDAIRLRNKVPAEKKEK